MFQAGGNVPRIWFLVLDALGPAWPCFGLPTVPRSIHGPGSGAGAIGTNASRWFCIALISVGAIAGHSPAGKKPEKAAASSEARGTALGRETRAKRYGAFADGGQIQGMKPKQYCMYCKAE